MASLNQRGFTLIELSIVVVVVALIVSGVVAGQSLVQQAQLRSILSDLDKFRFASTSFKGQYGALPGDFSKATAYFSGCSDETLSGSTNSCNGNNMWYM